MPLLGLLDCRLYLLSFTIGITSSLASSWCFLCLLLASAHVVRNVIRFCLAALINECELIFGIVGAMNGRWVEYVIEALRLACALELRHYQVSMSLLNFSLWEATHVPIHVLLLLLLKVFLLLLLM